MKAHRHRHPDDRSAGTPHTETPASSHDACGACPRELGRRLFLRDVALAALGVLAVGAVPSAVEGMVATVRPLDGGSRDAVERSYAIPAADGVSIDDENEVILARWQGRVYAFSARCTHRGARLEWRADEGRVFCPKHKARFQPDGAHASGRRTRDLDRHPIRRRGDTLVVDYDTVLRVDTDRAAWAAAVVPL
jgi:nitrite reductase/ring-hydroxylating ferredoxin subunit